MKQLLFYIVLLVISLYSCKEATIIRPAFFDRVADTNSVHIGLMGRYLITCYDDGTAGYNYYEFELSKRRNWHLEKPELLLVGPSNNLPRIEILSLGKKGLYLQNSDNPKPFLIIPFMPKEYTDTIRYRISVGENKYFSFKQAVIVDDVFYDTTYNDTIYKVNLKESEFHQKHRMFNHDYIIFIGKHVGIIGIAAPFTDEEKESNGKLLLYHYSGNIYAKKYNYSLRIGNYL